MAESLSVVIPAFNAAATLAEQLIRLSSQVQHGDEVIVVDNCSVDNTVKVAVECRRFLPCLRVVDEPRQGEAYARNAGVLQALNEHIAFCDADDVVGENWLRAMRHGLSLHSYVTGPVDVLALNPDWLASVRGVRVFRELSRTPKGTPFAHGCNFGVRRSSALSISGFNPNFRIGTDVDFSIRAHRAGIELKWLPDALVHYRHRRGAGDRWRQAVSYGRTIEALRRTEGVEYPLFTRVVSQWRRVIWIVRTLPLLYQRAHRARWTWVVAHAFGEVLGDEIR